jgi:hypothetical protein
MGFAEAATGKLHDLLKYRFAGFLRFGVCLKTVKEPITKFAKILLLCNVPDASVRLSKRNGDETVQNLHDLLLINHNTMSLAQNFFHDRMRVFDSFPAVFDIKVLILPT